MTQTASPAIAQPRRLGKSEVFVSPIIYGAFAIGGWMWGGQDANDAIAAIEASLEAGINTIDTAAIYGMGSSEELVARAIAEGGWKRHQVVLATKVGMRWNSPEGTDPWPNKTPWGEDVIVRKNSRADSIFYEIELSLKRLRTDYIDLYQIHWPDLSTPVEETIAAMEKLRQQGKIRAIGVSNYNVEWLERAIKVAPLASLQPPFSPLTRKIERDILPWCRAHEVGVIAYSPMERGLLTGKVGPERVFPPGDHRNNHKYYSVENRKRVMAALEEIRPIAEKYGATFAQIVVNWVVQEPGITAAIVGARNAEQARQNAAALRFTLNDEERAAVRKAFDSVAVAAGGV
jgi:aryl-alcohol dehydrogenase-like predicted oxidoreductase